MARTKIVEAVRGMGLGMDVLKKLMKAIEERGGSTEVLALLVRERFLNNLDEIAQAIVKCEWRIPATEMRFLAEKCYRENFDVEEDMLETVRDFWWNMPLVELGIPFHTFSPTGEEYPRPPLPIHHGLHNKPLTSPMFVTPIMEQKQPTWVVVEFNTNKVVFEPGDPFDMDKIDSFSVALTKYFDFDK